LRILLVLTLALFSAAAHAAGPKSSGQLQVSDDHLTGSAAGSHSAPGIELEGAFTQDAAMAGDLASGTTIEAGYFSMVATTPASAQASEAYPSSISFTWADGTVPNPIGTLYILELSTRSDFSYPLITTTAYSRSAAVEGLAANTTVHARIRAAYMEGDETAFFSIASTPTHANDPASALTTFTLVAQTSFTVHWEPNGNPPGTLFEAVASTADPYVDTHAGNVHLSSEPWSTPSMVFTPLGPNTTYYLFMRAKNHAGVPTPGVFLGSTATLANLPASVISTFSAVSTGSLVAYWDSNANSSGTVYRAVVSTSSILTETDAWNLAVTTQAWGDPSAAFAGLKANATYYLYAAAYSRSGGLSAYAALGSTLTRANEPATAASTFTAVWASSMAAAWSANENAPETLYEAWLSTSSTLAVTDAYNLLASTRAVEALFQPIRPATTYYLHVRTLAHDGTPTAYVLLGSTATLADMPSPPSGGASTFTAVWVGSVSFQWGAGANPPSTQYLAQASSAAFAAGTLVKDSGWGVALSTSFVGLSTNTLYAFRAKARNPSGIETDYTLLGTTSTLAVAPASAASTFTLVAYSSITLQWASGGNPDWTEHQVTAASDSAFSGALSSSGWMTALSTAIQGLTGDSTWYFRVQARSVGGILTDYAALGSSATLLPMPSGALIESVGPNSASLSWSANGARSGEPGSWMVSASSLPVARSALAAAFYGGRIYVSGGANGGAQSAVWHAAVSLEGSIGAWSVGTPLPAPRESHAMAAWAGRLYVSGGLDSMAKATVWWAPILSDGSLGSWTETTPLPAARYKHAMEAYGGRLIVTGGDNGITSQNTVYSADIESAGGVATWATNAVLPSARSGHAMAISSGVLYVSGGVGAGVESTVWRASLASGAPDSWNAASSLPEGRARHCMAASGDRLYVLGGHDGASARDTVYSGTAESWTLSQSLPGARFMHACVLAHGRLIALGGDEGGGASGSISSAALLGTLYSVERASDTGFTASFSSIGYRAGTRQELYSLLPNTTYYFRLRARSLHGVETAYLSLGSTRTLSALPGAASSTFTAVETGSITVSWTSGDNPAGTEFRAQASTSADFGGAQSSDWLTAVSTAFADLTPNTSYYFRAQSRNASLLESPYRSLGAVMTLAAPPTGSLTRDVGPTGFTLEWSSAGNPAWTRYEAQVATASAFSSVLQSSVTLSTSVVFSGLPSAATYYARVRALNGGGILTAYDAAVSAWTGLDALAPGVSTGTAQPAGAANALLVLWSAVGDDLHAGTLIAGSSFYVQWSTMDPAGVSWSTANAQVVVGTSAVAPGTLASVQVGGLPSQSKVWFRLWTKDEAGNYSAPSATFSAHVSPFVLETLDGAGVDAGRGVTAAGDVGGNLLSVFRGGGAFQELRFLERSGGAWGALEAPDPGVRVGETFVAVGEDGNPQVLYRNAQTGELKLAKKAGVWTTSVVASGNLVPTSLALDGEGRAHITYYDAASGALKYSSWTGTGWGVETVDASGGGFASLVIDAARKPHVAYYDAANTDLKYASRTANGWVAETVDGTGVDVGSRAALALDGSGQARIAYLDRSNGTLKFAGKTDAGWTKGAVDGASSAGGLALDGAGNAHVSYLDGATGELKYGRWTGSAWSTMTVDASAGMGEDSALSMGALGELTLLYRDGTAARLESAHWDGGFPPPVGGPGGRVQAPTAFQGTAVSSTGIQWSWMDNSVNELGFQLYGASTSTGPFALIAGTAAISAAPGSGFYKTFTETGLLEGTTYYRYAVAVASGGVAASAGAATYPFLTVDRTSPTVTVNQAGDDLWRRTNIARYDVDFADLGGSGLSKFAVRVSTRAGDLWTEGSASTDVVVSIGSDTFSAEWALPSALFDELPDGATSYVSVRIWDGLGNHETRLDAFYVRKDTTPPSLADNQAGDDALRIAAGTLYDMDAFDAGAGLAKFQYSVSLVAGSTAAPLVPWTDIPAAAGEASFTAGWPVDFAALSSLTTNYVSVRAIDQAGSTTTLVDAFYVRKDVTGPVVVILAPSTAYRSQLVTLSGTAADLNGVRGVEVKIQELATERYWTGASFVLSNEQWFTASGTTTWSLEPGISWTNGAAYRVVARSSDTLGNYSLSYSTADFVFDASTPSAAVTLPADGAVMTTLETLSGTATDPAPTDSGINIVQLRVRRNSDGKWWDFVAQDWADVAVSTTVSGAGIWSYAVPETLRANLASGTSYFLAVRAQDGSIPGNVGDFSEGSGLTCLDAVGPGAVTNLSALTGGSPGTIQLSWTAPGDDGGSGLLLLGEYRVNYSTDPAASFSTAAAQVVLATASVRPGDAQSLSVSGLVPNATYYLRAFLADEAGNWSPLSNGATAMAGYNPFNQITGHVLKSSSEPITAVLVEAFDSNGAPSVSTFTVEGGSFTLTGLSSGSYRVRATWTVGEVKSSVELETVAMGSYDVDFMLEIGYTLATLTGSVYVMPTPASRARFAAAASAKACAGSFVELFVGGRRALSVPVAPNGRWAISNLLPGRYGVRAYNGTEFTDVHEVDVGEGETKEVAFIEDPLPEGQVFAFPNPARSQTTVRFYSPLWPLEAQVSVFDIAGVLVRELAGSELVPAAPGVYHARWDLTNSRGEAVASGVYLFMVKVKGGPDGQSAKVIKKLAVVK